MAKTEGRLNENTGKVEKGKVPKGHSLEDPKTKRHFGLIDSIRIARKELKGRG